jgi:hypothetical protein
MHGTGTEVIEAVWVAVEGAVVELLIAHPLHLSLSSRGAVETRRCPSTARPGRARRRMHGTIGTSYYRKAWCRASTTNSVVGWGRIASSVKT